MGLGRKYSRKHLRLNVATDGMAEAQINLSFERTEGIDK